MSEPIIYDIAIGDTPTRQFVTYADFLKLNKSWKEMFSDGIQVLREEREEKATLQAENERLRKLFAETERLMLLDGEYEALKAGTYARLTAEVEYWKKGCER